MANGMAGMAILCTLVLLAGSGCQSEPSHAPSPREKDLAPMKGSEDKKPDSAVSGPSFARTGFATRLKDGRLWVFYEGAKELEEYDKSGELAKQVVRVGIGPGGVTIKGPDADIILAYLEARPGFVTRGKDGRLWVFRAGDKELAEFDKTGEVAKQVTRAGAGPGGVTLKGPDVETLDEYLGAPKYP